MGYQVHGCNEHHRTSPAFPIPLQIVGEVCKNDVTKLPITINMCQTGAVLLLSTRQLHQRTVPGEPDMGKLAITALRIVVSLKYVRMEPHAALTFQ